MNTRTMTRKKKELSPNRQLAQAIIDQYQPQSVEDMQDALKDIFGPMFEAMLQGEMNSHLGYSNNERGEKDTVNRRNGYTKWSGTKQTGRADKQSKSTGNPVLIFQKIWDIFKFA